MILLLLGIYVASGILGIINNAAIKLGVHKYLPEFCVCLFFFPQGSFLTYWLRSMNILSHTGKYLLFSVDTRLFQLSNLSLQFSIFY